MCVRTGCPLRGVHAHIMFIICGHAQCRVCSTEGRGWGPGFRVCGVDFPPHARVAAYRALEGVGFRVGVSVEGFGLPPHAKAAVP